ncbi:MAG: hypothetical protein QNJ31_04560 [Candidatus Caenarcaniphilales bacterium]|nr:hypothetical protein [Candidatus Caenarcaniphilales bacterium]
MNFKQSQAHSSQTQSFNNFSPPINYPIAAESSDDKNNWWNWVAGGVITLGLTVAGIFALGLHKSSKKEKTSSSNSNSPLSNIHQSSHAKAKEDAPTPTIPPVVPEDRPEKTVIYISDEQIDEIIKKNEIQLRPSEIYGSIENQKQIAQEKANEYLTDEHFVRSESNIWVHKIKKFIDEGIWPGITLRKIEKLLKDHYSKEAMQLKEWVSGMTVCKYSKDEELSDLEKIHLLTVHIIKEKLFSGNGADIFQHWAVLVKRRSNKDLVSKFQTNSASRSKSVIVEELSNILRTTKDIRTQIEQLQKKTNEDFVWFVAKRIHQLLTNPHSSLRNDSLARSIKKSSNEIQMINRIENDSNFAENLIKSQIEYSLETLFATLTKSLKNPQGDSATKIKSLKTQSMRDPIKEQIHDDFSDIPHKVAEKLIQDEPDRKSGTESQNTQEFLIDDLVINGTFSVKDQIRQAVHKSKAGTIFSLSNVSSQEEIYRAIQSQIPDKIIELLPEWDEDTMIEVAEDLGLNIETNIFRELVFDRISKEVLSKDRLIQGWAKTIFEESQKNSS